MSIRDDIEAQHRRDMLHNAQGRAAEWQARFEHLSARFADLERKYNALMQQLHPHDQHP